ncbi:MAG: fused MFS/spermidine synthase [Myxococcales bacterium]|nr:fused MFS/spermidine synthase [Myxococcales bacterium]
MARSHGSNLQYSGSVTPPRPRRLLELGVPLVLFAISGATALIAQLCFSRYLSYVVGATAYAVSSVLAAFMAGLALGAQLSGRWARHVQRPLVAYGLLELAVAAGIALAPQAFTAITPFYVGLVRAHPESVLLVTSVRWLLAFLVVLVPTTAMGATLPLLSRLLGSENARDEHESRHRERWLGALYAANTFGGALGALGAAYVALPKLGLARTLSYAAVAGASVGVIALLAGSRMRASPPRTAASPDTDDSPGRDAPPAAEDAPARVAVPAEPAPPRTAGVLYALALFSGLVVLGAEVVFTHLLALIIGNSAYAFGLILAIFLTCLGFGAALAPMAHRRLGVLAPAFALALAGFALGVTLHRWDGLPLLFGEKSLDYRSFEAREAFRGAVAFGILVVPTTAMGLTFPLLLQRIAALGNVSQLAGRLTAVNTVGAVLGSLVAGFVVLPRLGSQGSLIAVALALSAAAVLWAFVHRRTAASPRKLWVVFAFGVAATLASFATPRWDLSKLTAGTNVYFGGVRPVEGVVFIAEDVQGGVTTVTKTGPVYTLYTNGKFQGNNAYEMAAQRYFSLYPLLFARRTDQALVIGLGTAHSLGTLAEFPFRQLTAVEISPAIATAAGRYFRDVNRGVLEDPRVRLVLDDGRHHLMVDTQRYDVIGMELSSIWFAGASSLYSRDFYHIVREHLAPGGVFQQWIQLHHMTRADAGSILATLRAEFPHVALFNGGGQGILVASLEPLVSSRSRIQALRRDPRVEATWPAERTHEEILADCLLTGNGLDRFIASMATRSGTTPAALISNDDNVRLEFATPRGNVLPWNATDTLLADMREFRDPAEIEALLGP